MTRPSRGNAKRAARAASSPRALRLRDAAALLGVSIHVLKGLVRRGRLPSVRLSKRTSVVPLEAIEALLGSAQTTTSAPAARAKGAGA